MAKPAPITIPTEPIGSIPRPVDLIERVSTARMRSLAGNLTSDFLWQSPPVDLQSETPEEVRDLVPERPSIFRSSNAVLADDSGFSPSEMTPPRAVTLPWPTSRRLCSAMRGNQ
jgi:hypothetical protein